MTKQKIQFEPPRKDFKKIKNYGFQIYELQPEDWSFGSSGLGLEIRRPDTNWTEFLPTGEKQKRQDEDKMACVTFSALNVIETEFIYQIKNKLIDNKDFKWLQDNGYFDENNRIDFSDRFIAILSGTTKQGNNFKNVAQAIHKYGLIPENLLPYRKNMIWNEYYNKKDITQTLLNLGQKFLEIFPINYEFVNGGRNEFYEARKRNPIQVAIYAYDGIEDGVYIRTESPFNHAVENHNQDQIFDSYE